MKLITNILVLITTLFLCSSLGSVRAATLLVSNRMRTRGNVPVYVTCDVGLPSELSKSVPPAQRTVIEVPRNANANATEARTTSCYGTFYAKAHMTRQERPYVLYDSDKDYTKCKKVCYVLATDYGFYRWDDDKKIWGLIRPIIWVS